MIKKDSAEKPEIEAYFKAAGVPFITGPMEEGDYTNENEDFLLERKAKFDMLQSLINKKLYSQLSRMRTKHPNTPLYLLFEGDYKALIESQTSRGLKAMLATFPYKLAHIYGIHFIQTWNMLQTVEVLKHLDQYAKGVKDAIVEFEPIHMTKNYDERARNIMTLPGVGQAMAEKILKKYPSIMAYAIACRDHPKEVMEIYKLGKVTVNKTVQMYFGETPFVKNINLKKVNRTDNQDIAAKKKRAKRFAIQRSKYDRAKRG